MSMGIFADDVVFLQRFLKCSGLYPGAIDGIWGPITDQAVKDFETRSEAIAAGLGRFDARSEGCILTLQPAAQEAARQFLRRVRDAGIGARIISGTRTYGEQNVLYRKGRFGNPPPMVTKARGGQSNHNFGIAWDIGIFEGGTYLADSPLYVRAAEVGLIDSVEWGGHWTSFPDRPHYQLDTGKTITSVRASFETGQAFA